MNKSDLVVGNEYVVTVNYCDFYHEFPVGTKVVLTELRSKTHTFIAVDSRKTQALEVRHVELSTTSGEVLTSRHQIVKGETYKLVTTHVSSAIGAVLPVGTLVTLADNDDSDNPWFTAQGYGDTRTSIFFYKLAKVTPLAVESVDTPLTSKSQLVIGQQYKVVVINGSFKKGDIVTYTRDDGTACPEFTNSKGVVGFTLYYKLAKILTNPVEIARAAVVKAQAVLEAAEETARQVTLAAKQAEAKKFTEADIEKTS